MLSSMSAVRNGLPRGRTSDQGLLQITHESSSRKKKAAVGRTGANSVMWSSKRFSAQNILLIFSKQMSVVRLLLEAPKRLSKRVAISGNCLISAVGSWRVQSLKNGGIEHFHKINS